jgi:hypothetical protein
MQLPEFTHSTTLRWTLLVAGTFVAFEGRGATFQFVLPLHQEEAS